MYKTARLRRGLLAFGALLALLPGAADPAFAKSLYVDKAVAASGDGTSWAKAWKSFSKIRWSEIKPGDILYISGGSSGRTYTETLTVGANGAAGQPITIRPGPGSGHNGPVTIDGQNRRASGVFMSRRNHVLVTGFRIRNHANAGIGVKYATAGVRIENNDIYSGDPGGGNARGVDVRGSRGNMPVLVRGNSFSTPTSSVARTDAFWSSDNDGVVFEYNTAVMRNANTTGHSDGIHSYLDYNITIRGNWFEQRNSASTDNHALWLSDTRNGGVIKVYNNVVLVPNLTADSAITHWAEPAWTENGTAWFWNNTVIGGRRAFNLYKSPNARAWNNIVWPAAGGSAFFIYDGVIPGANIDHNLIWAPNATIGYVGDTPLSWSAWRARGYDRSGLNDNPDFVDLAGRNLALRAVSPAIDKAATLADVQTDILGTPRPQGPASDIGAYERVDAQATAR